MKALMLSAVILLASAQALAQQGTNCGLRAEQDAQSPALLMRGAENCPVSESELSALIESAIAQKSPSAEFSVSLGRAVKYPWLSQAMAEEAARFPEWDIKQGRAKNRQDNAVVGRILMQRLSRSAVSEALSRAGYRLQGVSVEKVLVTKQPQGKVPTDALVWMRVGPGN